MNFKELYATSKESVESVLTSEPLDFRLEQATKSKDDETWEVVVSYLVNNLNKPAASPLTAAFGTTNLPYERVFKLIKIRNKDVSEFLIYEKV
ncbi:hypothetical protein EGI26_20610 [Lacihabitans sp. CCS-44]|uniref:hypothetical protein n=1 Tax=Lacihabitans sp. CCS-44 TaxID=2487331 RepID=UPI0020CBC0DD|nr:hypothetical protein [Lacihabitans sp. CCS-44]MCP9757571.1 hypothetical protein [Lacihabitans sp. CCS-44]